MAEGQTYKCPVCGKETKEEYCKDCMAAVMESAEWLEDELDADWEQIVGLLGYFYERNY